MKTPKTIKGVTLADDALEFAVEHLNSMAGANRGVPQRLEVNELYSVRKLKRLDSDEANSSESEK